MALFKLKGRDGVLERYALALILVFAFAVRMLPVLLYQVPAGLDSYLHIDIAQRIIENGGILSLDPMSLVGLKAYSYPPGFHILLASFISFLPPVLGSHAFGALIGTLTVAIVFLLSQEVFRDRRVSIFAALFFAASPTHIFRTAMPIPEGFGVLLFTAALLMLVKYVKSRKAWYVAAMIGILAVYVFSHRGWSLFVLSAVLLVLVQKHDLFRRKRYAAAALALIAAGYYVATAYFSDLVSRINVEAVTALGYFKWMGIAQLALGACGALLLWKTKDRLKLFMVVWAALLLFVGSFSFRFRDPYAAIPLSLLAGYALQNYVIPQARKRKREILALIILVAAAQAVYTAAFVIEHPSPAEMQALTWIRQSTPADSMILTWKEEGYYIMGVTERKDILTWKKVYEGFFDEPPSVDEAKAAYTDMFVMFRSAQKEWMLSLMEDYSVDYIYIDARMRSELDALQYGLVEYLSYDTHFRPVFANDGAEIYAFVPDRMEPDDASLLTADGNASYSPTFDRKMAISLVPYLEGYWNGMAYLDHRDYRAHYPDNAKAAGILLQLYETTGDESYRDRAQWLLKWLAFEQLPDGAFFDQKYETPKKSTQATCLVISEIESVRVSSPGLQMPSARKAGDYVISHYGSYLKTLESSAGEDYRTDAACLPAMRKLGESGAETKLLESLLSAQRQDGSWPYGTESDRATVNSQAFILDSLAEYYALNRDPRVLAAMKSGALWLSRNRNAEGMFWNYVTEGTGRVIRTELSSYPMAAKAYGAAGMTDEKEKTISYLAKTYDPQKDDLEELVHIMDGSA